MRQRATTSVTVAKPRLSNLEKSERQRAESQTAVAEDTMTFEDALAADNLGRNRQFHLLNGAGCLFGSFDDTFQKE
jgi:hypothetical protein